jgi:hypothetical protein
MHSRKEAKDFINVAELVKQGLSLQQGFEAVYAIAELSAFGSEILNLKEITVNLCQKK